MSLNSLAPWAVTVVALAVAGWSWVRPAPAPERAAAPEQTATPAPSPTAVAAHLPLKVSATPSPLSPALLQKALRDAVRSELAATGGAAPTVAAEPSPEVTGELDATRDDALLLVDDLIDLGEVTMADRDALIEEVGRLDRARAEAVMTAYFNALNDGDIVVVGAPL